MDKSEKKESFGKKYGLILALIAMAIVYLGGADIFLDHSGSTYIIPKLSLYSTGLMPPKVILIRSSLYQ